MSAKAQRERKKLIKLVGGGVRSNRTASPKDHGHAGSMKAKRRQLRKLERAKKKGR